MEQTLADLKALLGLTKGIDQKIDAARVDLLHEREKDKFLSRLGVIIAATALFAACLSVITTLGLCLIANRDQRNLRNVIDSVEALSARNDTLRSPEQLVEIRRQRQEIKDLVYAETKPLNCSNPVSFFFSIDNNK